MGISDKLDMTVLKVPSNANFVYHDSTIQLSVSCNERLNIHTVPEAINKGLSDRTLLTTRIL